MMFWEHVAEMTEGPEVNTYLYDVRETASEIESTDDDYIYIWL